MLLHKLLVFNVITAARESVSTRTVEGLIPLLQHTSQHCNVCLVGGSSNNEVLYYFIRTFWASLDPIALIHGSSNVVGHSVKLKCHLYLIPMDNHKEYVNILTRLASGPSWNLYAMFVFYTECIRCSKQQFVENVRRYSTEVVDFGIARSVLIYHLPDKNVVRGFHAVPFQDNVDVEPDIWDAVNMLTTPYLRNIHKQPIVASSVYEFSKLEIGKPVKEPYFALLNCLANQLNGTAVWIRPLYDGFVSTVQYMFYTGHINIFFKAQIKSEHVIHVPVPVITSDCFLVPERKIESYSKFMYVPFSYPVWITLVIIVVICCLMSKLFRKQFPRNIILQVLFGASVSDHQMDRPERFTCFSLAILLFYLSESYLSLMISFMLANEYYPHLKTLDDFLQSNVHIIATPAVREFLQINHPEYIGKTVEPTSFTDGATIIFRDLGNLFVDSANNIDPKTKARKSYLLPETFEWNILQHTVSRYEPLGAELLRVQVQLIESGIWDQWHSRNQERFKSKWRIVAVRTLQFDELISMWYILAYGFAVSGIGFTMEWVVFWWNRRNVLSRTGIDIANWSEM